jgi:hypothetical protein
MMKLYEIIYNDYLISNDKDLLSLEKICDFLSRSYWEKNRYEKKRNKLKILSLVFFEYKINIRK